MSAKDLLAVLLMVVPGFLLIALIALTLVPASVLQPFQGSGLARDGGRKAPDPQPRAAAAQVMPNNPDSAVRSTPAQKNVRGPSARVSYDKAP